MVQALRRLVTVCDGLGWQRHEDDALEEANAALSAYDDDPDDEGGLDPFVGPDGRLSPGGDE